MANYFNPVYPNFFHPPPPIAMPPYPTPSNPQIQTPSQPTKPEEKRFEPTPAFQQPLVKTPLSKTVQFSNAANLGQTLKTGASLRRLLIGGRMQECFIQGVNTLALWPLWLLTALFELIIEKVAEDLNEDLRTEDLQALIATETFGEDIMSAAFKTGQLPNQLDCTDIVLGAIQNELGESTSDVFKDHSELFEEVNGLSQADVSEISTLFGTTINTDLTTQQGQQLVPKSSFTPDQWILLFYLHCLGDKSEYVTKVKINLAHYLIAFCKVGCVTEGYMDKITERFRKAFNDSNIKLSDKTIVKIYDLFGGYLIDGHTFASRWHSFGESQGYEIIRTLITQAQFSGNSCCAIIMSAIKLTPHFPWNQIIFDHNDPRNVRQMTSGMIKALTAEASIWLAQVKILANNPYLGLDAQYSGIAAKIPNLTQLAVSLLEQVQGMRSLRAFRGLRNKPIPYKDQIDKWIDTWMKTRTQDEILPLEGCADESLIAAMGALDM